MTTPGFRPTHVVPQHGMPAWEAPDPARPTVDLDPLLPVQLLERQGDWGHVLCFNGWSAWVDGRRLVAVPQDPPAADGALTRAADPRPLLGRAQEALARYRSAVEDLAAGLDRESFRTRTHGIRVGVVVDGESVWLYDSAHGHWVYADGARMNTYATDETPEAEPASRPAQRAGRAERAERAGKDEGAEPAEPVSRRAEAPVHPPTRVVPPEAPPGPVDAATPEPPEPTRAVAPDAPEPTRVVAPNAPEPTRVVAPEAPEPTRVVAPDAPEATRVVAPEDREDNGGGEGEGEGQDEGRGAGSRPAAAPPTRVVGHEPTRVVSPEGEGR
ncbi:hypothetical protein ACFV20_26940 [Streptomyces sp. NPDC059696]|uniref:hypothetical protein n=1 Tax=Streptomyces sp. NPDC059696 TaxID=3346911 RepID=UPI0036894F41